MRAYLTPLGQVDDTMRRIDLEEGNWVGVYRDGMDVVAESADETRDLGVRDMTVSRKKSGQPPVRFTANHDAVEIENHAEAKNDLTVETGPREFTIAPGETGQVSDSCQVNVGSNTDVRLTVEDTRGRRDTLSESEVEKLLEKAGAGSRDGSVKRGEYARQVADRLRMRRRDTPNDCLQVANEVKNFVHENPLDEAAYEETREAVDGLVDKLDTMVSNEALRREELDQENRERVERVASRVESLYAGAE